MSKLDKLKKILKDMGSVLVAYSGGVDSTLLLKLSHDVLNDKVLAVIATSETYPGEEIESAKIIAESLGVPTMVIETKEFNDEKFISNSKDRCYYCKIELFSKLNDIAKEKGLNQVIDGSNYDDRSDYRPGNKAKKELGIRSPLEEAGFRKDDVRELSRELGLPTWDKPSMACLSSRIPYGTRITKEKLKMVEEAEKYLRSLGFKQVRVRHHGHIARIEVPKDSIPKIMDEGIMNDVSKVLEKIGYLYVTLDLKGYRTGSLNELVN